MLIVRTAQRAAALMGGGLECSTSGRLLGVAAARYSAATATAQSISEAIPLAAEIRESAGSIAAHKLRKAGKTPGVVFSGPGGEQHLLAFESQGLAKLVTKLGRTGWAVSLFDLLVRREDGSSTALRALGRQVHMTADTDAIENVTLIECPADRHVRVEVPLKVIGDDVSPGLKAGGRINWIRRTIPCLARGDSIPADFTVDISKMGLNDKLYFTDLAVPQGATLHRVDPQLPILKITK